MDSQDFTIKNLGECKFRSPLNISGQKGPGLKGYISDEQRVLTSMQGRSGDTIDRQSSFEVAGPREKIFFKPAYTKAAIVTCGGLCPGINCVIRSLVAQLYAQYGIKNIVGFRFGYQGFNPIYNHDIVQLEPSNVQSIHREAGTFLGSSRGAESPSVIVDRLEAEGISMLFAIGGDGTLRAAHKIALEIEKRNLEIVIMGIPKTIDNDIKFVYRTFGFDSAVEEVRRVLDVASAEAKGAPNGIGLVKVMGRDAGFIAAHAAIASRDVDFVLIPEFPFDLAGEMGLMMQLEKTLQKKGHCIIIVSEGAGQDIMGGPKNETDKSGNVRYNDIGVFLRDKINDHCKSRNIEINLKYIEPSYTIRSILPNANDAIFCDHLSRYAVHAAMAGKTDMVVGLWHNVFTHVPISAATSGKKRIIGNSTLFFSMLETSGQPHPMKNTDGQLSTGDKKVEVNGLTPADAA